MVTVVDKADPWEDNEWYRDQECGMPEPEENNIFLCNPMVNWLAEIAYWKVSPTYVEKMWEAGQPELEIQIAVGANGLRISVINLDQNRVVDAMVVRYQAMAQCLRDYGVEKGFERLDLEPQMEELAIRLASNFENRPKFCVGLMSAFSEGRVVIIRRCEPETDPIPEFWGDDDVPFDVEEW